MMEDFNEIHIEKDFWDDFISEAFEHIEEIETNAMSLEQDPTNMDLIHTMFRAFHTIKGLSGFVEHTIIQEIAHKTETMMDYCRKGELAVNTEIVNSILRSSDYIRQLCDNVDSYKDENLINNIKDLLQNLERISSEAEQNPFEAQQPQNQDVQQPQVQNEQCDQQQGDQQLQNEENVENQQQPENFENAEQNREETPQEGLAAFAEEISQFETPQENQASEGFNNPEPVVNNENVVEPPQVQPQVESVPEPVVQEQQPVQTEVQNSEENPVELTQEQQQLKSFQDGLMKKLSEKSVVKEDAKVDNSNSKLHSANEEYMKVASSKIDHLVDMMGELIINQALIEQYVSENYSEDKQLVANMSGFLRITRELQNLSMSLRMVALKPTFQKLTRIARDTIQELHKEVDFVVTGEGTEIDRAVAEKLLEPLVHMIKNAISHGVEADVQDRLKLGKPERAKVELNAYSKRGKIFIEVKDDGRGINPEVVYNKALEKGLIDPNRTYSDAEIRELIMLPGFSTAKVVDNISGRGVGMDVVKTQIQKTGGKVEILSTLNEGSTFVLEVPVNHAIMNGTIIEMNNQHFVVPTINVKEFLQPKPEQWIYTKQERTMIRVRDNIISMVPLSTFFKGVPEPENVPLVMVLELEQELRAVPIVNVISRQEVVVKPVGTEFQHLKFVSGMSILGTGKVSLILDIDYLFKKEVKE